jgi:hypothetical protein
MKYLPGSRVRFCVFALLFAAGLAAAQDSAVTSACGKAKVTLDHPEYLTDALGIIAAEPPSGWVLDKSRRKPFYFFKRGENYESARTLMYVNVERLEVPFRNAVQNDAESFQSNCQPSTVREEKKPELLERGCEAITQLFSCNRRPNAFVELVTKISIGGLLLNVVISGETRAEVEVYRKDYQFLLDHLTLVN